MSIFFIWNNIISKTGFTTFHFFITNFFHIQVAKAICFFKRITCKFSSLSCLYLPMFQISISNLAMLHNGIQNSLFMKVVWLPVIYFFSRIRFPNDVYHGIIQKVCHAFMTLTWHLLLMGTKKFVEWFRKTWNSFDFFSEI